MWFELGNLLIDLVLAGLLCGTLVYAVLLNRSLNRLRGDREALASLSAELTGAALRAETAMTAMRETARTVESDMRAASGAARATLEELDMIVETGQRLATRIERASTGLGKAIEPRVVEIASAMIDPARDRPAKPQAASRSKATAAAKPAAAAKPRRSDTWSFGKAFGDGARAEDEQPLNLVAAIEPARDSEPRSRAERQLAEALRAVQAGR